VAVGAVVDGAGLGEVGGVDRIEVDGAGATVEAGAMLLGTATVVTVASTGPGGSGTSAPTFGRSTRRAPSTTARTAAQATRRARRTGST